MYFYIVYQVLFYQSDNDDSPIDNFLDKLDIKARAKVEAYLSLLAEHGPNLKRPYADHVRGKIRELRVHYSSNQYRILYFFYLKDSIVLVHAFAKKTQQLKAGDIELAERRMSDWLRRRGTGG